MNIANTQALAMAEMIERLDRVVSVRDKKLSQIADLTPQQWDEAYKIMAQFEPEISMKRYQLIGAKMLLQKMK